MALRYCNEIPDHFVRPYAGSIGQEFILMDDNACPHRATSLTPIWNLRKCSYGLACLITGPESD